MDSGPRWPGRRSRAAGPATSAPPPRTRQGQPTSMRTRPAAAGTADVRRRARADRRCARWSMAPSPGFWSRSRIRYRRVRVGRPGPARWSHVSHGGPQAASGSGRSPRCRTTSVLTARVEDHVEPVQSARLGGDDGGRGRPRPRRRTPVPSPGTPGRRPAGARRRRRPSAPRRGAPLRSARPRRPPRRRRRRRRRSSRAPRPAPRPPRPAAGPGSHTGRTVGGPGSERIAVAAGSPGAMSGKPVGVLEHLGGHAIAPRERAHRGVRPPQPREGACPVRRRPRAGRLGQVTEHRERARGQPRAMARHCMGERSCASSTTTCP